MEGLATQCVIAPRAAEVGLLSRAGAKSLEERSVLLGVLWVRPFNIGTLVRVCSH